MAGMNTAPEQSSAPADSIVRRIHGPIVSSGDLEAHARLFAAFGLVETGRVERDAAETMALWGAADCTAQEVTLQTPGTEFGVRLVAFDPPSGRVIRDPARGRDTEALKVIDFYAPDLEAARDHIEAAGFRFKPEVADYDTPEGRFREAHLWGPDGVVCALISGDPEFYLRFATVTDRLCSEPQSISGPIKDSAETLAFFKSVLGLEVIYTYGIHEDDSFQALVGSASTVRLRAWNVGLRTTEPYFGVIDYGLKDEVQHSLLAGARPPVRGLIGASLIVRDVRAVARAAGSRLACAPVETTVPGFGRVLSAAVAGPNGCWFQLIESLADTPA